MTGAPTGDGRPVVVVTGGGGGIGAAVAEHLGGIGWFVVTVDPLVTLDGSEQLREPRETTAERIVAAGGAARASGASVTDAKALASLLDGLVEEEGRLDAVVNVAGISRPTSFTGGSDEDWRSVLTVHLDGYLNVLRAALPLMAAAGEGRIVGVTSGSGWRDADAGAYGCAKRAVAALTWTIGRHAPPGVVVNAMSPIAATRMVTAALAGRRPARAGGLALGSMPTPQELGPLAAHLVSREMDWCRGRVIFAGGSEIAVLEEPKLIEVVRVDGADDPRLAGAVEQVFVGAERAQASTGGGNPRLGTPGSDGEPEPAPDGDRAAACVVVSDDPHRAAVLVEVLEGDGLSCTTVLADAPGGEPGGPAGPVDRFADARSRLAEAALGGPPPDAVVVALGEAAPAATTPGGDDSGRWREVLAEHEGLVDQLHTDAAWMRAVADLASTAERPVRVVTLTGATTSGGRSRAQAAAQLARAARSATGGAVAALAVSIESAGPPVDAVVAALAAELVGAPAAVELSGAELVVDAGWLGLRRHPRPAASITMGPQVPDWLDATLRRIVAEVGS